MLQTRLHTLVLGPRLLSQSILSPLETTGAGATAFVSQVVEECFCLCDDKPLGFEGLFFAAGDHSGKCNS